MEISTEKPIVENLGQDSFFNSALANVSRRDFTHCRHVASVIAFDGYIVKVSSLPCIVGSLCSIENEAGASVTGEVVRICLLYTSPSSRDGLLSRMPSSA